MDDTVIFATSREMMHKKLQNLKVCADNIGMVMHPTKSRFMAVNTPDTEPFMLGNVAIKHTKSYTLELLLVLHQSVNK